MINCVRANLAELKLNRVESYNLYREYNHRKKITPEQASIPYYINGIKKPSYKQVEKILTGIKEVGRELMELEIR